MFNALANEVNGNLAKHAVDLGRFGLRYNWKLTDGEVEIYFFKGERLVDAISFFEEDTNAKNGFAELHTYLDECIVDVLKRLAR